MNERLKLIRTTLGMNQTEFGARLGVTVTAISKAEKGTNSLSKQLVMAVCREYGISETWLRTGAGDMRIATTDALMAQLSDTYNLNPLQLAMVECFLTLPQAHKDAVTHYITNLARSHALVGLDVESVENVAAAIDEVEARQLSEWDRELTIDEKTELYRQRLIAEHEKKGSSTTLESPQNTNQTKTGTK